MTGAHIAGIAVTELGRLTGRTVRDMAEEVVRGALADAGLETGDVEAAWFSNTRQALMEGQNSIRGQVALRDLGLPGIPITNIENACASSTAGVWSAIAAIDAGMCDVALVVGSEKMIYPEKSKEEIFRTFLGGTDISRIDEARAVFDRLAGEREPGATSDSGAHTFFMDMYAAMAKHHMRTFGTTQRQIACVAAKNHGHSVHNPVAQYRHAMTVEDVLADREVTFPLTRSMCAPVSDGAAAAVIVSDRRVRANPSRRTVRIRACAMKSGSDRAPEDYDRQVGRRAARAACEAAGIEPADIDVAEVHDATAFGEIVQIENLGLAARGDGGPVTEAGETTLGGRCPVNTSGGLLSKGHPIAATGIVQLHELVAQLRGEAGGRQVDGARIAVAENGGGFVGVEEAAAAVTVLESIAGV